MVRVGASWILERLAPVTVVLLVGCSADGAPAKAVKAAKKEGAAGGKVNPAEMLRKVAGGADTLVVETVALGGEKRRVLLKVDRKVEIADLLRLIETPAIDENSWMHHLCTGQPKMIFSKSGKVLAEVSFDHVSILRPYSKGLWGDGDVHLTETSARAMAKWFERHGLPMYQEKISAKDQKGEHWRAFHDAFPPRTRAALAAHAVDIDWGAFDRRAMVGSCAPGYLEPLASEVPDPIERARTMFRAVGRLADTWSGATGEEAKVFDWAACIEPRQLLKAVKAARADVSERRGAAKLVLHMLRYVIDRLEPSVAEALLREITPVLLAERDIGKMSQLLRLLMRFRSNAATRLLKQIAARATEPEASPCHWEETTFGSAALTALVVLAERRSADPAVVKQVAARAWQCRANRSAARIAVALAANQLPGEEDLEGAGGTAALMTLERIKRNPSEAALGLARAVLLAHRWEVVRGETKKWLAHLTRQRLDRQYPSE